MEGAGLNSLMAQETERLREQLRLARLENERLSNEIVVANNSSAAKLLGRLRHIEKTARWSLRRLIRKASAPLPARMSAAEEIRRSGLFDTAWYHQRHPEVRKSGDDPIRHYIKKGARQFFDPSPLFDTD